MKQFTLKLAIALACEPSGCSVRFVDDGSTAAAVYAEPVQDRIKIRPGDLVAIDRAVEPPAVVWRWWYGTVTRVDGATAFVERNVTQREPTSPRSGTGALEVPAWLAARIAPGVAVFIGGEHSGIVDAAIHGIPAHPDRLRREGFPRIVAEYAHLSEA